MTRQGLQTVVIGLLLVLALAVILIPDEYWPREWVRYKGYNGEFVGQPIILNPPLIRQDSATLKYSIEMTEGVCRISFISPNGDIKHHSTMGSGYVRRDKIASKEQLLLDPGPNSGNYSVGMGLKYHVLSPFIWRSLAYGILIGMIISIFVRKDRLVLMQSLKNLFTPIQWVILIIITSLTSLIFYPIIHESGHALSGMMLGGSIKEIVFTPLSGEEPHVSFSYLPDRTGPLMNASGVFLPILFAYILFSIWFVIRRSLTIFQQALLLVPTVLLLFPGLFVFDDHLRGIAMQLGCTGEGCIFLVKTIPAWFTIVVYAILGWQLWRRKDTGRIGVRDLNL